MPGHVYLIKNTVNSKVYVGQTIRGSLETRFIEHCAKTSGCLAMSNAIKKYGRDNFIIESVFRSDSLEELNKKEQELIKELNTLSPNGYNLRIGGENHIISEESRLRMSQAQSGENHHMFGKHHSKETIEKMSKASKGKVKSEEHRKNLSEAKKGHKLSEETKAKMSASKIGVPKTEETKKRMSKAFKGIPRPKSKEWCENQSLKMTGRVHSEESKKKMAESKKKKVICNETNTVYPSISEAAASLNCHPDNLKKYLSGKYKACKGLTFRIFKEV